MRTAARRRVLLSEASSFTAREFVTVLGRDGAVVDAMSSVRAPIARFSRYCRAIRRVPAPSQDPLGYLAAADRLMASGEYDALLPTHEQAWLFSAGRHLMRHRVEVADIAAFDRVESKIEFARLLDDLRLPQPAWRLVENEGDLAYRRTLTALFDSGLDAVTIIKLKDIVQGLESCADAFEELANVIESLALKES